MHQVSDLECLMCVCICSRHSVSQKQQQREENIMAISDVCQLKISRINFIVKGHSFVQLIASYKYICCHCACVENIYVQLRCISSCVHSMYILYTMYKERQLYRTHWKYIDGNKTDKLHQKTKSSSKLARRTCSGKANITYTQFTGALCVLALCCNIQWANRSVYGMPICKQTAKQKWATWCAMQNDAHPQL